MSSIFVTKQAAIERLEQLRNEILDLRSHQNKKLADYNKIMEDNFGFTEDGKSVDKLDMLILINKMINQKNLAGI